MFQNLLNKIKELCRSKHIKPVDLREWHLGKTRRSGDVTKLADVKYNVVLAGRSCVQVQILSSPPKVLILYCPGYYSSYFCVQQLGLDRITLLHCSQAVRPLTLTQVFAGSNPASVANNLLSPLSGYQVFVVEGSVTVYRNYLLYYYIRCSQEAVHLSTSIGKS